MNTAILLHLHYQDLWEEFKEKIVPILSDRVHLYVTVHDNQTQYYEDIVNTSTEVFVVENRVYHQYRLNAEMLMKSRSRQYGAKKSHKQEE